MNIAKKNKGNSKACGETMGEPNGTRTKLETTWEPRTEWGHIYIHIYNIDNTYTHILFVISLYCT